MKSIQESRETGKGVVKKFKEQPTHTPSKDSRCPHCYGRDINIEDKIVDEYEIPSDIEFMNEHHDGYSWTEDRQCGSCGGFYSMGNGC